MWGRLENENVVLYKDSNMIQHNSNIRAARSLSLCPFFFCMNKYIVLISGYKKHNKSLCQSLKNKMSHMLSYGKSPETLYQLIFCQID